MGLLPPGGRFPRSSRPFVELLIGGMFNPEGWVTRAIGAIRREARWTAYYKLIGRAPILVGEPSIRLLQRVLPILVVLRRIAVNRSPTHPITFADRNDSSGLYAVRIVRRPK